MNLLEQRPWNHPAFAKFVVLPILPFIVGGLVIMGLSYLQYQKDHAFYLQQQTLQSHELPLPSAQERTATLDRINMYDSFLSQIYAARAATARGLKPFVDLVRITPRNVHVKSVTFNGSSLNLAFESMTRDPYITLDTAINKMGGHLDAPTSSMGDSGQIDLTASITLPESQ